MRKSLFVSICLMFFLWWMALLGQAQTQSRVVTADGKGVPDVDVGVTAKCFGFPDANRSSKTNAEGYFTWDTAPALSSFCLSQTSFYYKLSKEGFTFDKDTFSLLPANPVAGTPGFDDRRQVIQAIPSSTQAQAARVVDLNGQAVSGVEIKVDGYCVNRGNIGTGSATITRQTNSNGEFAWDLPCSGSDSGTYTFTFSRSGYFFTRGGSLKYAYNNRGSVSPVPVPIDERLPVIYAAPATIAKWKPVSAADYADAGIANDMILAGFGNGIAAITAAASLPLPTTLGARKIVVRDMTGKEAIGRFFFVSPRACY